MAALEEVVLYAFQQCVYYLSKVRAAMMLTEPLLGPWAGGGSGMSQLQQGGSSHCFHLGLCSCPSPCQEHHHGIALWSSVLVVFTAQLGDCHAQPCLHLQLLSLLLLGLIPAYCLRLVKLGSPVSVLASLYMALGVLSPCSACMSASRPSWNALHFRQSAGRAGAQAPLCRRNSDASCLCSRPPRTSCGSCRCILRWPPRCLLISSSFLAHCSSTRCWTRVSAWGWTWLPLGKLNVLPRERSAGC